MSRTNHPRATARVVAALVCLGLVTVACAADEGDGPAQGGMDGMDGMRDTDGMGDMGDMGDMAEISVAGQARVNSLPPKPLAWLGYHIEETDGERETHAWGPAFLYADDEARTLTIDGVETTVGAGEAVFVDQGVDHTAADGSFWAFVLADPEADPAPGLEKGTRELSSGPLEGLPDGPAEVRFLIVDLPPEVGQTAVHSHPGPEFVYVARGEIEYETGLRDTTVLTVGEESALPADTAVQKRNVNEEPARFWSWFIVDPDEPFSAEAEFGHRARSSEKPAHQGSP